MRHRDVHDILWQRNSEESTADIVGTWQLTKDVLYFDGEQVDVEGVEDDYVFQYKFKSDGTAIEYDDGDIDGKYGYVYSPESKTLTFLGDGEQMEYHVDRLTSSELVLSEDLSVLGNILDYDEIEMLLTGTLVSKSTAIQDPISVFATRKTESITLASHLNGEEMTTSTMTKIPSISNV